VQARTPPDPPLPTQALRTFRVRRGRVRERLNEGEVKMLRECRQEHYLARLDHKGRRICLEDAASRRLPRGGCLEKAALLRAGCLKEDFVLRGGCSTASKRTSCFEEAASRKATLLREGWLEEAARGGHVPSRWLR
jgi:hypothetical protein